MADWMAISPHLDENVKFRRLARRLHTSRRETIGVLYDLWSYTFDQCPSGDLSKLTAEDYADVFACDNGEATTLFEALVATGFIERIKGTTRVHDWQEFGGRLHCFREGWKERQSRRRHGDVTVTSRTSHGYVTQPIDREIDREKEGLRARDAAAREDGEDFTGLPQAARETSPVPAIDESTLTATQRAAKAALAKRLGEFVEGARP